MKILMVLGYYFPYVSGLSEYVKRISEALASRGHKVTVVTSQHDKQLQLRETINGVEVIRCHYLLSVAKGLVMPTFVLTVLNKAKSHDVVNIHLPMFEAWMVSMVVPNVVVTYHCDLRLGDGPADRLIQRMYYLFAAVAMKKTRRIITYTEDYARNSRLLRHYIGKCVYVNPIVDDGHFKPVAAAAARFKKMNGMEKKKVVGFAGRFVHEKGLPYLLRAIPAILTEVPNAVFVFAGEYAKVAGGSIMAEIKGLIDRHRGKVVLLGNVPYEKLPEFYSACDVLVLPSIDPLEAFGIVQIEAMLCGTPVVATDLPGVRIPIGKTGMGMIIRQRDAGSIADAVVRIIKGRRKYVKSRSQVVRHFSRKHAVEQYERALHDA